MKSIKKPKERICDVPAAPPKEKQLEAKYLLKIALDFDRRRQPRHHLVFGFLLEWYVDKNHKDALASVRWIAEQLEERSRQYPYGRGLGRSQVQATLADLVAWNYLIRTEIGVRGAGSRWVPNWSIVWLPGSGFVRTVPDALFVRTVPDTVVRTAPDVNGEYVRTVPDKDPSTRPGYEPGTEVDGDIDSGTPAGSGVAAYAAAGPAAPEDGFAQLWRAYGLNKGRPEAKAAFAGLKPDVDRRALIEAATAWRMAAEAKPGCKRKWLATWLTEERYEEDAPGGFAKPSSQAANRNNALKGRRAVEIVDADVSSHGYGDCITVDFRYVDGGSKFTDKFALDEAGEEVVGADKTRFEKLCAAIDVAADASASALVGETVEVEQSGGRYRYFEHVPAYEAA